MKPDELVRAAAPDRLSTYLTEQPNPMHHHHGGPVESVREADHEGHHIVIRTAYTIEVDGRPIEVPLGVDNDGHVHCHSLPNYQFLSAINMVKQLISSFPKDFPRPGSPRKPPRVSATGGHDHMHMHMNKNTARRPGRKKKG
jgi:hypothetical protein